MRHAAIALVIFAVVNCVQAQSQPAAGAQTPTGSSPGAQPASQGDATSLMNQGTDAFRKGDCAGALPLFRQVISADATNIVALNLAGNCELQLKDYDSAADFFKRAMQVQPDEFHNLAGLMRAYTLGGNSGDRDALQDHINTLENAKQLPPSFNYLSDAYDVDGKRVELSVFPQVSGAYGYRYNFDIFDSGGREVLRVSLESNQSDQPLWAKQHPKEAAAGDREFSLDGYGTNMHETFRFYEGEPALDDVRGEVQQIIEGKMGPMAVTHFNRGTPPSNAPNSPSQGAPAGSR